MERDFKVFHSMSPFEVKNELIHAAKESCKKKIHNGEKAKVYNAGRGNPNFLNTKVRFAFYELSTFVTKLAESYCDIQDLGMRPPIHGIYDAFKEYTKKHIDQDHVKFLDDAIEFALKKYGFSKDDFLFELCDAALGDFYPMPSRIFPCMEQIEKDYLADVLCPDKKLPAGKFNLFATEGASAAMVYLFNSLKENKLLNQGDVIAIVTPIFSPYIEMPVLNDYQLMEINIEGKEELGWQIPDSEIEKLKDPKIKAIYMVNPTNPTSVAIDDKTLQKITNLVKHERKDLIVLTDTVYATFVDGFHSIIKEIPENTICVYSYSKYFGVTGWRLGLIMIHEKNIINQKIQHLKKEDHMELFERYKTVSPHPEEILFIDRLEIDSRQPALAHTGGLSGPQQLIMGLFSLYELMDEKKRYKKDIHQILKTRIANLYNNMEVKIPDEKGHTYYYTLIDLSTIAKDKYGEEFKKYLMEKIDPLQFLFDLADYKHTICLPGEGFAGPKWSIRVSLANLNDEDYITIGKNIKEVLDSYYQNFKK